MVRPKILLLLASALATPIAITHAAASHDNRTNSATSPARNRAPTSPSQSQTSASTAPWPVATSLSSTLTVWARRQGWPAPQFLTEADWAVDVPGAIPGSIEDALKVLVQGFETAPSRPRIALSANHVMLVTEAGAQ